MAKESNEIEVEGVVRETLRGLFKVEILPEGISENISAQKQDVLAHLSGKLKKNFIRIVIGDRVKVAISPYDMSKGRITYRMK